VHRARNLYVNLRERVKRAYRQALGEPPPRQTTTGNLSRGEFTAAKRRDPRDPLAIAPASPGSS
jgi:hypothetical protein